eukprot:CAMPEP_0119398252 /NCGR_PEP_ID=MMETSP1334-20130426/140746_1 /TAXON_ID=127549 /ORGANISM="Calcidiscus leptoporus, Strain RCC1130" /LENGTH=396 /DNA_ID=CAMNT_0007422109 /DNA_START=469 /DNA_END=1659 /DNA_ORIENTATION=-
MAVVFLLFVFSTFLQSGISVGGMVEIDDIGPSSKVHLLASFALSSVQQDVCMQANSIVCERLQAASVSHISRASSQVVSGVSYHIVCETDAGSLTLSVFEQVWTDTLVLKSASLTQPVGGASLAFLTLGDAIEEGKELALDAKAFHAIVAASAAASAPPAREECTGGAVFKECGSQCTRTCDEPAPMCVMMCVAKCECPQSVPILKDGRCVPLSECSPCVPDLNKPCPKIFRPVCSDGTTYANACLADAECKHGYTDGACPVLPSSSLLIGGAPITPETYGGHYTGTDAVRNERAAQASLSPEAIVLERANVSERASFIRTQRLIGFASTAMGLALLLTLGVFLARHAAAIRRWNVNASEVMPMRSADAQDSVGVRVDSAHADKTRPDETSVLAKQ